MPLLILDQFDRIVNVVVLVHLYSHFDFNLCLDLYLCLPLHLYLYLQFSNTAFSFGALRQDWKQTFNLPNYPKAIAAPAAHHLL